MRKTFSDKTFSLPIFFFKQIGLLVMKFFATKTFSDGVSGTKCWAFFCVMTNGGDGAFKLAVLALKRSFKPSLVIPAQF